MNKTNKCITYVNYGMVTRIILTIVSFTMLYNYKHILGKNIYLILPILLLVLDKFDNVSICTDTFYYQINDKIVDLLSYLLVLTIIPLHTTNGIIIAILIIYRLIGVLLFGITKVSISIIIFFDFVKEYLLYFYLFRDNFTYLTVFVIAKFLMEYIQHYIINKTYYN
jgi:hypothetical protein